MISDDMRYVPGCRYMSHSQLWFPGDAAAQQPRVTIRLLRRQQAYRPAYIYMAAASDLYLTDTVQFQVLNSHSESANLCQLRQVYIHNKLCAWGHNMPPPFSSPVDAQAPRAAEPSRRNVAAVFHGEHVPTRTAAAALRVKAALSKSAW